MAWLAHYDADLRAGFLDKVPSRERVNRAFIARYHLTEDEQNLLRDVLRGDVIYCPTVSNSHPMLRTFHSYAEWIVDNTMKPWGPFLDIGGNPRLASERRHVVVLANNARDQLRLARSPNAAQAFARGHLCLEGAENCGHGPFATRAVAVHSAYDITPTQWFLIMSRNKVNLVDVFIWDPDELHGGTTLPSTDAFGFRLDLDEDEDSALFLPLDGSPGYKHSLENWRWYREGHATCGPYQLITYTEHVWGPFRHYSLVLTLLPVTRVFFKTPLNRDWVHVPVLGKGKYVAVPTQKWRAVLNWGFSRIDTNFSRSNLAAYLRAISARVVIGSREYTSAWNPDEWTFAEVVTSAFVMCAILRSYGSTTIGAAMKQLSHELKEGSPSWWRRAWTRVKSWFCDVEDFTIPDWDPEPDQLLSLVADHIIGELSILEEGPRNPPCLTMDVPPDQPQGPPADPRPDFSRYRLQAIEGAPNDSLRAQIKELDSRTKTGRHRTVLLEGPPGSGKSSGMRKRFADGQDKILVITPVGRLAEAWKDKGFTNVTTHHKAAGFLPGKWEFIVVDEAFMMHPGLLDMYAACAPLILLGDPRQVGFIDWDRNVPDYSGAQLRAWVDEHHTCNVSFRVPDDAAQLISSFSEPFKSASPVKHSLFLISRPDEFPGIHPGTVHLCFTQAVKARIADRVKRLKLEGQNVMTVHEAQGLQFKHVALHLDVSERMFIASHPEHLAVGMSRHTDSLVITEHGYTLTEAVQTLRTPLGEVELIPQEFVPRTTTTFSQALEKVDLKTIQESGGQAGDLGPEKPVASVHTAAAQNLAKPVQISLAIETDTVVARVPANSPFMVLPTRSTDHAQAQAAVIQRPATVAPVKATGVDAEKARGHVNRFIQMACKEVPRISLEDLQESLAEALRKIHDKNGNFNRYLQDGELGEFLDSWVQTKVQRDEGPAHLALLVNGFLKTQRKFNPELKVKPGQPIQPVHHLVNLFFSQVFRAAAAALRASFKDNVLFVDGHSEKQLSAFVARHYDWRDTYLANDFTAFDSTQGERTMLLEVELLKRLGLDPAILDLYRDYRLAAKYSGPGADIPAAGMRMSGEANTLLGNTLVTGILHCAYVNQEPAWMMFKGDDAIMAGPDSMDVDVETMHKDYGMKAKLERMEVPEFVSFFISPYGLLPDFFRIANKMCSNDHQDTPEWREASAANARAILELTDNPAAPAFAMLAAERKYRISPEQSWAAFTIVCDRAAGKFEQATPNLKLKLKVNPEPPVSFHRTTICESRSVQSKHRVDGV
uniref:Non-structural polyprotein n=1 Tax=Bastrovirus 2 TaxID=1803391 RepID=A0A125RWR2_9VIRU|nr:non-structural polyprotein [Bastrovirus 2]